MSRRTETLRASLLQLIDSWSRSSPVIVFWCVRPTVLMFVKLSFVSSPRHYQQVDEDDAPVGLNYFPMWHAVGVDDVWHMSIMHGRDGGRNSGTYQNQNCTL